MIDLIQCVPLALPPYYNDERDLRPVKPLISSCLPLSIFDQLCPKTERSVRESSAPLTKSNDAITPAHFHLLRYTQPEWSVILGDAPDFVEVGEAGIAMDDAMRRQRRVQLVG